MIPDSSLQRIGPGKTVTLHFSVCLADGQLLDTTRERPEPATFTVGDGSLTPGFEQAVFGLKAGDRRSIVIPARDGFGDWQAGNVQTFARHLFVNTHLDVGLVVSFADKSKAELPGVVKALREDEVEVDFNHPLAGRDLLFEVDIISVRDADAQPFTIKA
jgi:FKBP-type peptidyl-prolyl cis-trans isomerase SlpA